MTFTLGYFDRLGSQPPGFTGDDVRDVMLEAIEQRFGNELPSSPVKWLSDNGSAYTA